MVIVYTATRNFYRYLKATIRSLFEFNEPRTVYILAEDDELPFAVPGHAVVINVSGMKPSGVNATSYYSYMSLIRPMLADIVPEDKVIYLDVDTVVCDSLLPMWETDMTGKWWAAVREIQRWHNPFGPEYYNNGVSVYNLKQMRDDGIVPVLAREIETVEYKFPDQDIMNKYAVPNKVVRLDNRFNEAYCTGFTLHPAVVHYAGAHNWFNDRNMFRAEYLNKYR